MSQPAIVVQVSTNLGTQMVDAVRYGAYAVHPRLRHGEAVGPGWVVTHCDSGLAVWSVEHQAEAEQVAEWLALHSWLPEHANRHYLLGLVSTPDGQAKLVALRDQLQQLAPRWPPL